jgi:quinolinate synthase
MTSLARDIQEALVKQNAVLVAHYYVDAEIQKLAQATGGLVADSLEMARFGTQHPADTLIVCGVRFMGETAKILNPDKRVVMPTLDATCSLDEGCSSIDFKKWCARHPEHVVVVYANTSAAVKAQADWVVTSSIAVDVVQHLHQQGHKILWAPDRHLGRYIQQQTGADMIIWEGDCIVHREFQSEALASLKKRYRNAAVLVHPEAPIDVIAQADVVGSTQRLLAAVKSMHQTHFIIATDQGLFYAMQSAAPAKQLILAPTIGKSGTCQACGHCPWMQMNSLKGILSALSGDIEIKLPKRIIEQARVPLERMLQFQNHPG